MAKPMLSEWQRLTMLVVLVVLTGKFQARFLVTAMDFSSFSNEISTNILQSEQRTMFSFLHYLVLALFSKLQSHQIETHCK